MSKKRKYEIQTHWGIDEFLPGEGGWSGGESDEVVITGLARTRKCYEELKAVMEKYRTV